MWIITGILALIVGALLLFFILAQASDNDKISYFIRFIGVFFFLSTILMYAICATMNLYDGNEIFKYMPYDDILPYFISSGGILAIIGQCLIKLQDERKKVKCRNIYIIAIIILSILLVLSIFIGITFKKGYFYSLYNTEEYIDESVTKDKLKSEMAKKEVNLAFHDFELGQPIKDCIAKAKNNKDINITRIINGKDISVEFSCMLYNSSVDCKVCSFEDTITSLVILCTNPSIQGVETLYAEKYGEPLKYNDDGSDFKWEFKNGSINILIQIKTKERIVVKKGRENLNPNNLSNYEVKYDSYFQMLSITYNDFYQINKVNKFEEFEKIKNDSINKIHDSINKIHKKKRIQEEKIKEQKKKSKILEAI